MGRSTPQPARTAPSPKQAAAAPPGRRGTTHVLHPDAQVAHVVGVAPARLQLARAALQQRQQLRLVPARAERLLRPLDEPQPDLQRVVALVGGQLLPELAAGGRAEPCGQQAREGRQPERHAARVPMGRRAAVAESSTIARVRCTRCCGVQQGRAMHPGKGRRRAHDVRTGAAPRSPACAARRWSRAARPPCAPSSEAGSSPWTLPSPRPPAGRPPVPPEPPWLQRACRRAAAVMRRRAPAAAAAAGSSTALARRCALSRRRSRSREERLGALAAGRTCGPSVGVSVAGPAARRLLGVAPPCAAACTLSVSTLAMRRQAAVAPAFSLARVALAQHGERQTGLRPSPLPAINAHALLQHLPETPSGHGDQPRHRDHPGPPALLQARPASDLQLRSVIPDHLAAAALPRPSRPSTHPPWRPDGG